MKRMPRAAAMLVWVAGAVALHAVVPFELSRLGDRVQRPRRRRLAAQSAGVLTVASGAALVAGDDYRAYLAAVPRWLVRPQP